MPFTAETTAALRTLVDKACADPAVDIPGTTVVVVDKTGAELFAHAAGRRGLATAEAMTLDHVFWLASCTKMVTAVACMQLVERGVLALDDGAQVARLCPELTGLDVLRADGTVAAQAQARAITLRMLLTHTAGFGYSFFNERLRDWALPVGLDEFSGRAEDLRVPLLFQPGEGWEYGVGLDWAGLVLERATGRTLDAYLQQHVLGPLGLRSTGMLPSRDMRARLAHCHFRQPDGRLRPRDHLLRAPLVVDLDDAAAVGRVLNSGGAGLFAQPQEYCKILAVLLNGGTCPRTGAQILQKATVDEMFRNQIPQFPNASRQPIPAAKPELTNAIPELYPVAGNPPQGWGLSFMLSNGGSTGRSPRTAHWAGLINSWWWCDRDAGVAGIVCTQILPFADSKVLGLWAGVEAEVYKALGRGEGAA